MLCAGCRAQREAPDASDRFTRGGLEALATALFGDGKAIGLLMSYEQYMPAETSIFGSTGDAKPGPRAETRGEPTRR
jgi:hypothetical protein